MKKCLSYLLLIMLVGVYMLSTMGYGIHKCTLDGSNDVILLFGETPCDYVHSSEESLSNCICGMDHSVKSNECDDENSDHNNNCCSTETYVISSDQVNSNNDIDHTLYLAFAYLIYNNIQEESISDFSSIFSPFCSTTSKVKPGCRVHVENSQFRV